VIADAVRGRRCLIAIDQHDIPIMSYPFADRLAHDLSCCRLAKIEHRDSQESWLSG
jgi:hypothetical protein